SSRSSTNRHRRARRTHGVCRISGGRATRRPKRTCGIWNCWPQRPGPDLHYALDDGNVVVNMEARVMAPAPVLTVDEYFRTPETLRPAELVYGALRVAESPSVRHQQAVGAFFLALSHHLRARRLGHVLLSPMDVVLDYERALIVQPDLLFVSKARAHILKQ